MHNLLNNFRYIFIISAILFSTFAGIAYADSFNIFQTNLPPFNHISQKGKNEGISVDILKEIMEMNGYEIHVSEIRSLPLARSLRYTEHIDNSIFFSLARTSKREDKFKWVGPIYNLKLGLISKKNSNIKIKKENDLKNYKIAVIRDSAPQFILIKNFGFPEQNIVKVSTDTQQFKMLNAGRVDMITQSDTGAPSLIREAGLNPGNFEMNFVMMELPLYYALNKNFPDDFVKNLQKSLESLKSKRENGSSRMEEILSAHLKEGTIAVTETNKN